MEYEPNTLCVQPWQRYYQIVNGLDVRYISLVKVEIGTPGAEEGGEDEIEFTIRKTVHIGKVRHQFGPSRSTMIDKAGQGLKGTGLTSFPNNTVTPLRKE